jgi:hypothetical protein
MEATDVREPVPGAPPHRRSFGWVWVLIAALVVVGVFMVLIISGGGGKATLTYTGDELRYDGPEEFDDTVISVRMENTSESDVAQFEWGIIAEGTTEEQYLEWAEAHPYELPPWLERWQMIDVVGPGAVKERELLVQEGTIDFVAWNPQGGGPTHVVGIFEVSRDN